MQKTTHILNAASNLLGITLLIIAGLHISDHAQKTFADEVAWVSALCFSTSCGLSYLSIRAGLVMDRWEGWADRTFLVGIVALVVSVLILAI
ncbi:MAG: hypothetical protein JWN66_4872 [Sphingomonas bacterium]|jgi:hypothetical protein|uniref:hypothetical protein n=1 Tax=Sphingomonas bacterium TaxID=1895847 RepID=UPI0026363949|nr:hypothetical protein [Sphingomonas bacterium]MDB5707756.1 hypothetical protein [Sphingomonas bacterium]